MTCAACGTPFEPRRKDQRFCSSKCRLVGVHQKQEHARRDRDAHVRIKLRKAQHAVAEALRLLEEQL
jgi:predicted nucleic acid-binding Zn ribbon protein